MHAKGFVSHYGIWIAAVAVANALVVLCLLRPPQQKWEWSLFGASGEAATDTEEQWEPQAGPNAPGPMVKVSNVNVMIHSGDTDHFVEAGFALEVASEEDRQIVKRRLSRLREASIGLLSGMRPEELRGSEGLEKAKATLLESFQKVIPHQRLKAVYVTNLVVD